MEWTEGRADTVPGAIATVRQLSEPLPRLPGRYPLTVPYRFIQFLVCQAYRLARDSILLGSPQHKKSLKGGRR
jgi:hypothetical protein